MGTLFSPAEVDGTDERVIGEIQQIRRNLQSVLRTPKRWVGGLRRTAQAWAIQGSNTIEGYAVSDADAVAAVDRDEPLTADQPTWAEILGYRRVLTYVNNVASYSGFTIYEATLNAMHFMLLEHDLAKSPGRYRYARSTCTTAVGGRSTRDPIPPSCRRSCGTWSAASGPTREPSPWSERPWRISISR